MNMELWGSPCPGTGPRLHVPTLSRVPQAARSCGRRAWVIRKEPFEFGGEGATGAPSLWTVQLPFTYVTTGVPGGTMGPGPLWGLWGHPLAFRS